MGFSSAFGKVRHVNSEDTRNGKKALEVADEFAKVDIYGQLEATLKYYGMNANPEELTDSELFLQVAHLKIIREAEAEASNPKQKSKTAF